MSRLLAVYRSSIGKKACMGVTGLMLLGFVIAHMAGNLKAFQGRDKFNAYAEFLREMGAPIFGHAELLWILRIGLVVAVVVHVLAAVQLARQARAARPTAYQRAVHLEDPYASRTMRWGGVIIALFVIYHLLHLTFGQVHRTRFVAGDVYGNVVAGFQVVPIVLVYAAAVVAVGIHLYHGVWSGLQTLGVNHPRYNRLRRSAALAIALIVTVGYLSVPAGVLLGIVQ